MSDSSVPFPVLPKSTAPSLGHHVFDRNGLWMEFPCKKHSASTPSPMKIKPPSADDGAAAEKRSQRRRPRVLYPGPVIVGGGPSGLAVAACLKKKGIPSLILERAACVGSLWRSRTYDRLCLHLPKQFCELPMMPFPAWFPKYPTREQFLSYLENYVREFDIQMVFDETVVAAEYDDAAGLWRLRVQAPRSGEERKEEEEMEEKEYVCPWLVAATGENAEAVMPEIPGMEEFKGPILHSCAYRSGDAYRDKRVLVVGCGNSGMEVALDLSDHNALPSLVVRDTVHILPRDVLGGSTFGLSILLLKWLPIKAVDLVLLLLSRFALGDTSNIGFRRPPLGPLAVKSLTGKTPVLDVGTIAKIRSGHIKVRPGIERILEHGAEFVDGRREEFDALILATGYKSNVPLWLKEKEFFSEKDGMPRRPFPNGWKGENGLYAVGFSKRGLLGASLDATRIAQDIDLCRKAEIKKTKSS